MSILDWRPRGEYCIESIAGDDAYYSIEKIPDGYSWAAWLAGSDVGGKMRLTIGSLTHCKSYCEVHYSSKQPAPTVEAVEDLLTAELIQPLPTISRRDYFAAMAMQGLLVGKHGYTYEAAKKAVVIADALIEALGDG